MKTLELADWIWKNNMPDFVPMKIWQEKLENKIYSKLENIVGMDLYHATRYVYRLIRPILIQFKKTLPRDKHDRIYFKISSYDWGKDPGKNKIVRGEARYNRGRQLFMSLSMPRDVLIRATKGETRALNFIAKQLVNTTCHELVHWAQYGWTRSSSEDLKLTEVNGYKYEYYFSIMEIGAWARDAAHEIFGHLNYREAIDFIQDPTKYSYLARISVSWSRYFNNVYKRGTQESYVVWFEFLRQVALHLQDQKKAIILHTYRSSDHEEFLCQFLKSSRRIRKRNIKLKLG